MKEFYEAFGVEPAIETRTTVEHICNEDGCELRPVTKQVELYPRLNMLQIDKLFSILIKHKNQMNYELYQDIVNLITEAKGC